ncbi:MAG: glycosyltransferase, partial [Rhodospirillaceae bacterium]|nr:glycosyltransferase [Rhodospirillaceae bacterium]
ITWLGAKPQTDVLEAYRNADLFVLASKIADDGDRDGLPNVMMEAQSQNLPIAATRVSAVPELIDDGEQGLLAEPGDPVELALNLERLIREPDLRRTLGVAGGSRVRSTFAMDTGIDDLAVRFGLQEGA